MAAWFIRCTNAAELQFRRYSVLSPDPRLSLRLRQPRPQLFPGPSQSLYSPPFILFSDKYSPA